MKSVAAVLLALLMACEGSSSRPLAGQPFDSYVNEVDGISVTYPASWHRAEWPLSDAFTGGVEILGLSTVEPSPPIVGCSPYPWSTMSTLADGDVVLVVRAEVTDGTGFERLTISARPQSPMDMQELDDRDLSGGCALPTVRQWASAFRDAGRLYTAFLAVRGELSEARASELQATWASLELEPVTEPRGEASIGVPYWHVLSTHCGITATSFNGREWVADPPQDESAVTPPQGWHGPFEVGLMSLIAGELAEFRSRDGQRVATFRPRAQEDAPVTPCD